MRQADEACCVHPDGRMTCSSLLGIVSSACVVETAIRQLSSLSPTLRLLSRCCHNVAALTGLQDTSPSNLATGCFTSTSKRMIHLSTVLPLADVQNVMHTRSSLYTMKCSHTHSCSLEVTTRRMQLASLCQQGRKEGRKVYITPGSQLG